MIFNLKPYPIWFRVLNYGNLFGVLVYPFVVIASFARLGDHNFYQPTRNENLLIYTYPILLLIITALSIKIFKVNKILAAVLPIMVVMYYCHLISSGTLFEIKDQNNPLIGFLHMFFQST